MSEGKAKGGDGRVKVKGKEGVSENEEGKTRVCGKEAGIKASGSEVEQNRV